MSPSFTTSINIANEEPGTTHPQIRHPAPPIHSALPHRTHSFYRERSQNDGERKSCWAGDCYALGKDAKVHVW